MFTAQFMPLLKNKTIKKNIQNRIIDKEAV